MIKNTTSTTFSSRIYFVPKNELRQIAYTHWAGRRSSATKMAPDVKEIYEGGLRTVKNIQENTKGFTEGIVYCIGGLLKEGDNRQMFHFYPPEAIADMQELKKTTNKIDKKTNLKGLILGGSYCAEKNDLGSSKESLDLLSNLKKIFKKSPTKDFTIFFGQKNDHPQPHSKTADFIYDNAQDKYFISLDVDEITPENIKNYFKFSRVSPHDEVFIGGKKIDSKLIET